jgi:hypothetical protein
MLFNSLEHQIFLPVVVFLFFHTTALALDVAAGDCGQVFDGFLVAVVCFGSSKKLSSRSRTLAPRRAASINSYSRGLGSAMRLESPAPQLIWSEGTFKITNGASLGRTAFDAAAPWTTAYFAWATSAGDLGSPGAPYVAPPFRPGQHCNQPLAQNGH